MRHFGHYRAEARRGRFRPAITPCEIKTTGVLMTKNGKWIALFMAWALYGALTVAIIKHCSPGLATGLLFIIGSASYFTLISLIIFGRRNL